MRHWLLVLLLLPALPFLNGCGEPAPSERDLLYYFRNARIEGEVRRLWPAGQEYANKVLAMDAALEEKLAPLHALTDPFAFPPTADPAWRDEDARLERLAQLRARVEGSVTMRDVAMRQLKEAVAKSPEGIDDTEELTVSVWEALEHDNVSLESYRENLEQTAADYLALYESVQDCSDRFDSQRPGLAFTDEGCRQQVIEKYDSLRDRLVGALDSFAERAEVRAFEAARQIPLIDKRAERLRYEYLNNVKTYYVAMLEDIPKRIKSRIDAIEAQTKKTTRKLADAKDEERQELEKQLASLEGRGEELKASHATWRERVRRLNDRIDQLGVDEEPPAGLEPEMP